MTTGARSIADALLAVVIAPTCAACASVLDAPLDGPVCSRCWLAVQTPLPPLCVTCGDSLPSWRVTSVAMARCARCRRVPPLLDAGRAAGAYAGSLRQIVHAFKYEGRRSLAGRLASMMRLAGQDLLADADCVVPVPLHPWRRLRRGFNQATDLARGLDLPVVHALWRRRLTAPQAGLTATQRRRNVHRAFGLSPLVSSRSIGRFLDGRVVVLVDDVRTTGATLNACALTLKRAGAAHVRALTAARAAPPGVGTRFV